MAKERTLSIIKPDGVKKNLIGKIISRFEDADLKVVAAKLIQLDSNLAGSFYEVHKERPFYGELVEYMTSGPVFVSVLEGEGAVAKNREIMGATDPKEAAPGTIRADFAESIGVNTVHGSDSLENAGIEVSFFFPDLQVQMSEQVHLLEYPRDELADYLREKFSLPAFRARQLIQWLYKRRVCSFDSMTDISLEVRKTLESHFQIYRPEISSKQVSKDGTRKYLFKLEDGSEIESVLIAQPNRYTLCVSSQVGCAIGCKFCRTALMGLKRNLSTYEIICQVLAVLDDCKEKPLDDGSTEFTNMVFMGMGEPLHNVEAVVRALRILNDELGCDFSARKITVSTSGLIPGIEKFYEMEAPANLAVSLNATSNDVRTDIMPINKKWPIEDLLSTLRKAPLKKNQRLTMEYVMLAGVNDTEEDLKRLAKLMKGLAVKINLIPYNENAGLGYKQPSRELIMAWQKNLLSKGFNTTIRWSKGEDISAACGQLATESGRKNKRKESTWKQQPALA